MINAKLIKKGSHVQINNKHYRIHTIDPTFEIEATLLPGGPIENFSVENLQLIPITEEYLLTYNLKKDNDGRFHSRGNIIFQQVNDKWTVMTQIKPNEFETHPDLESIHELQFYSMKNTGEDAESFGLF